MVVQVVLVHGIRTSATMWRSQIEYLGERGNPVVAVDLPGHGSRMPEKFALDAAFETIDEAVRDAAAHAFDAGVTTTALIGAALVAIAAVVAAVTRSRSR